MANDFNALDFAPVSCSMPMAFDNGEPVFNHPWQAQAFAMTLALHEKGLFTWAEWAQVLAETIKQAQAQGDPDHGDTYYDHWLRTLEKILSDKAILEAAAISKRQAQWVYSAHMTPHGMPIILL